jgi:aryl-alcohol dehydrogenase-like predicted oxidoreductase
MRVGAAVGLVLGTAQLTRAYGVTAEKSSLASFESAVSILAAAEALGFSAIDTAPVYGDAERVIGSSGGSLPVHTKLSPGVEPEHSVQESLHRLGRNWVEIVYLHQALVLDQPQQKAIGQLEDLRGQSIGHIGVSIYDEIEFDLAVGHPSIDVIQVPYNIFDQRFGPDRVREASESGKEVVARSTLLQGVLLADPKSLPAPVRHLSVGLEVLQQFAAQWSLDSLTIALGFARRNSLLSGIIVGAAKEADLLGIRRAFSQGIPEALAQDLTEQSWPTWPATDPRKWSH